MVVGALNYWGAEFLAKLTCVVCTTVEGSRKAG